MESSSKREVKATENRISRVVPRSIHKVETFVFNGGTHTGADTPRRRAAVLATSAASLLGKQLMVSFLS